MDLLRLDSEGLENAEDLDAETRRSLCIMLDYLRYLEGNIAIGQ